MSHAHFDANEARLHLRTPRGDIALDAWPMPRVVRADAENGHTVRPGFSIRRVVQCCRDRGDAPEQDPGQLHLPFPKASRFDAALRSYWSKFPPEVVRTLLQFEGRYSFHLAQWCAAGGLPLLQRVPVLGFAAALRAPCERAELARSSDLDLAARFGFRTPSAEIALAVLTKVPAASAGHSALRLLIEILRTDPKKSDELALAQILPRLNLGVLRLLRLPARPMGIRVGLFEAVSASRREDSAAPTADKLERIARYRAALGDEEFVDYDSMADVDEMLGELAAMAGEMPRGLRRLPDPPFSTFDENSVWIVPIRSAAGVVFEGRIMRNCLRELRRDASSGELSFYRMLAPRRATICLERDKTGTWRLQDMREEDNETPARHLVLSAAQWVASQQDLPLAEVLSEHVEEHLGAVDFASLKE